MTNIYFVRHAQPNYENLNDMERELTSQGLIDRYKAWEYLKDKDIQVVLSSPYKRSVDTVAPIAEALNLQIETYYDLRERTISNNWMYCPDDYAEKQWTDFTYKLECGESLAEVQQRNIKALQEILKKYPDKNIAIGSHGTAMSTIINYYNNNWLFDDFLRIKKAMPFIAEFVFDKDKFISCNVIEKL